VIQLPELKAFGLVVLLFLGIYVPTFAVVSLIKPSLQAAIPLVIGLSLAVALTFICFFSSRVGGLAKFGFEGSGYGYLLAAVALGVPAGLALTFIASRFDVTNAFRGVSLRPWMIFIYFIVGTPIQEEVIFRGFLQTILERRFAISVPLLGTSVSFAAVFIAVLFGLTHVAIGVATAIAAFILGLLAGELRRRSCSLLPAIVLHAIFNAFSTIW
jgi:hypothetical protein